MCVLGVCVRRVRSRGTDVHVRTWKARTAGRLSSRGSLWFRHTPQGHALAAVACPRARLAGAYVYRVRLRSHSVCTLLQTCFSRSSTAVLPTCASAGSAAPCPSHVHSARTKRRSCPVPCSHVTRQPLLWSSLWMRLSWTT